MFFHPLWFFFLPQVLLHLCMEWKHFCISCYVLWHGDHIYVTVSKLCLKIAHLQYLQIWFCAKFKLQIHMITIARGERSRVSVDSKKICPALY